VQCLIYGGARNCLKLKRPDTWKGWEPLGCDKALLSESTEGVLEQVGFRILFL
jgi:hypothetical protein